MNVHRSALAGLAAFLIAQAGVAALDVDIIEGDIRRAAEIANSPRAARARFHQAYDVAITDATVQHIEVITEFRRFVMEFERQNALGNWMMARGGYDPKGRTVKDILRDVRGQIAIRIDVRLHPLHSYSAVPPFEIALGEPSLLAVSVARTPVTSGSAENGFALTGAIIETAFNSPSVGDATLPVQVSLAGKEIVRVRVDFSRLE